MEKPAAIEPKLLGGLLARLLCGMMFFMCAWNVAAVTQEYIDSLEFVPSGGYFFTESECLFTLDIHGVPPEDVQVFFDVSADDVQFLSSRKSALVYSDGEASRADGTTCQLKVQFARAGVYKIPAVYVRIERREYRIPFPRVTVYQNPQVILPELSVLFSKPGIESADGLISADAGELLYFTLYIRYAVQIVGFSWEIPENSLFEEVKRYEITEGNPRGTGFSPEAVPVATFLWQPLVPGVHGFPEIHVRATAYNGSVQDLAAPAYSVSVSPRVERAESSAPGDGQESVFAYAFVSPPQDGGAAKSPGIRFESYDALYSLRCAERHSFPWSAASRARSSLEKTAGLSSGSPEPSVPLLVLFCVLSGLFLAGGIVLLVLRKIPLGPVLLSLALFFGAASVVSAVYVVSPHALFRGGELCGIPEPNGSSGVLVPGGTRVSVRRSAGGWVYIRTQDLSGWVRETDIDYIR